MSFTHDEIEAMKETANALKRWAGTEWQYSTTNCEAYKMSTADIFFSIQSGGETSKNVTCPYHISLHNALRKFDIFYMPMVCDNETTAKGIKEKYDRLKEYTKEPNNPDNRAPWFVREWADELANSLLKIAKMAQRDATHEKPAETGQGDVNTSTPEPDSIVGDIWNPFGIPINIKKLSTKLKHHPFWLAFCLLAIVLITTFPLWWPVVNKIGSNSSMGTKHSAKSVANGISSSSDQDVLIEISEISVFDEQPCDFPYKDKMLCSFDLTGSFKLTQKIKDFSLVSFYKIIDTPEQLYGWFLVKKIDKQRFSMPNALRLDEYKPESWTLTTQPVHLSKDKRTKVHFIAFVLTNEMVIKLKRDLLDTNLGFGQESLDYLKKQPNTFHSKIGLFEYDPTNKN